MAQTIKKLLNYYLTQYPITEYLELFKNIIFDDISKAHENELAEKEKEHKEQLKRMYEQFKHDKELEIGQYKFEIEQQQLYKEDFKKECLKFDLFNLDDNGQVNCLEDDCLNEKHKKYWEYWLKDSSKYNKLPSKDIK